ncbi:MAG: YfcC family protein [Opitutaceae bacterium]|nr:YfcC family protein [Opitutaceae bacterium]
MKKLESLIPHAVVVLFLILVSAAVLSYILPAGQYERIQVEGRLAVVPGSYHAVEPSPVGLLDMFRALPRGFRTAVDIIFIVFASGIMFGFLDRSGAIENTVGTMVRRMGFGRRYLVVIAMTFLYGALGVFTGFESSIPLIPIAALLSLAIGGDLMLAAGISIAGVAVGFGLSPINPYTVGTAHKIAHLPLFSGAGLRTVLCVSALALLAWYNGRYFRKITGTPDASLSAGLNTKGLSFSRPIEDCRVTGRDLVVIGVLAAGLAVKLWGVFVHHWHISDIAALYCLLALAVALISRHGPNATGEIVLQSVAVVAPGAFMVGYASAIKEVLEMGRTSDTIAHYLSSLLDGLPIYWSALGMTGIQSAMNFLIPSGSGQALATMPVLIPVGEVLGLTRQTTVLAFQVGDGLTNLVNPALGGLIAMLALCRVPFDRWLRFITPYLVYAFILASGAVVTSVAIGYGPF